MTVRQILERATGFEPATKSLGSVPSAPRRYVQLSDREQNTLRAAAPSVSKTPSRYQMDTRWTPAKSGQSIGPPNDSEDRTAWCMTFDELDHLSYVDALTALPIYVAAALVVRPSEEIVRQVRRCERVFEYDDSDVLLSEVRKSAKCRVERRSAGVLIEVFVHARLSDVDGPNRHQS